MTGPAVLFDLDGTLVDSRPGIVASLHAALRELGHVPDPAVDLTWAIGPPLEQAMERLLAPYGDRRCDEAARLYRRHYAATGVLAAKPYPGIERALAAIAAFGGRLFVATSKRTQLARRLLDHVAMASLFAAIDGSEPDGTRDTKVSLIAAILAREGISPSRAVMIGDRLHDVAGAHANDMRCIGVAWGYGGIDELAVAGADLIASTPEQLPRLVARSCGQA